MVTRFAVKKQQESEVAFPYLLRGVMANVYGDPCSYRLLEYREQVGKSRDSNHFSAVGVPLTASTAV